MSQSERSFIMIKPDGVQRNLVGEVIKRFEQKGFKLVGLKLMSVSKELAEEHYGDLSSKPFFPSLVSFIVSSPVVAMVWEGAFRTLFYRRLLPASSLLERASWRSHASPISSGVNLVSPFKAPFTQLSKPDKGMFLILGGRCIHR